MCSSTRENKSNRPYIFSEYNYISLHKWIRRNLPKPENGLCEFCLIIPFEQVACITRIYDKNFKNWRWLCHKCHMDHDKIIERNLVPNQFKKGYDIRRTGPLFRKKDMSNRICLLCNRMKTSLSDGYTHWYNYNDGHICKSCYNMKLKNRINRIGDRHRHVSSIPLR